MKVSKIFLAFMVLSVAGTAYIYNRLPDQIPVHWGIDGQIDRYGNKIFAFVTAALPLLLYGLFFIIPKIDPRKENYEKHAQAYGIIVLTILVFLVGIHWTTMAASLGYAVNIPFMVKLTMGLIFIVIGNYMPQIKPNYFLGIRTPWTLANETVWIKTHRVGGYAFMIIGLVFAAMAFVDHPWVFFTSMSAMMVVLGYVLLYSWLEFRKISR